MRRVKPLIAPLIIIILAVLLQPLPAVSQEKQYWSQSLAVNGAEYPLMAKDAAGDVYIVTRSFVGQTSGITVVKYNSGGTQQWTASYTNANFNFIIGIGVDNAQNVYVGLNLYTSSSSSFTTSVIKFSSVGQLLWINPAPGANGQPYGNAMTVDAAGNCYVTGFTTVTATPWNVTYKLNTSGVEQWVGYYIGPTGTRDEGFAITVDNQGNVYVAGKTGGVNTITDMSTVKYAAAGYQLWAATYSVSDPSSQQTPYGITVDTTSGNVYVVGQDQSGETVIGNVVAYSSGGTQLWAHQDNTSATNTQAMVDYAGNVITVGGGIDNALFTATQYTSSGSINWNTSYSPSQGISSGGFAGALDNSGNLYVTMSVGLSPVEYCTQEYYSNGTLAWTLIYNGPSNALDYSHAIAIQNPVRRGIDYIQFPEVFVTGTTTTTTSNTVDLTTIMYSRPPIFLATAADTLTNNAATLATPPVAAQLSNYPNPFHSATTIAYTIPHDGHVTLQVYDATGRPVTTLVDEDETAGPHQVPFNAGRLAAGNYAYRIVAQSPQGTFTQTKQMIIE